METTDNQTVARPIFPAPPTLSEEGIKRAFVPFLRNFYKDRYAILRGTEQTTFDNIAEEGYIADGKIQFVKNDDSGHGQPELFICTFEATSRDKVSEVRFHRNDAYLVWDSIAFAAMFTAGFYVLSYAFRTRFLYSLGGTGNLGLVVAVFMLFFSAWFFFVRGWKKYRYIYAIEQFKNYFADEQWVALAEDVFPSPRDPFLAELKNQCVFNGFGLAIVQADGQVRPLATPSRLGIYGKDRHLAHWLTRSNLYQNAAESMASVAALRQKTPDALTAFFNQLWRPFDYLLVQPAKKTALRFFTGRREGWMSGYDRYMTVRGTQKLMALLSIVVLGFFVRKTLSHKDIAYAEDDKNYTNRLERRLAEPNPEDYLGYVDDAETDDGAPRPGGIAKQAPESAFEHDDEDSDVQTIDLSGSDEDKEIGADESPKPTPQTQKTKTAAPKSPTVARRPVPVGPPDVCAAVRGKHGWLLQDGFFMDKTAAQKRIETLRHRGLTCSILWRGCLEKDGKGYFVCIGGLFPDEKTARAERVNFQKALQRYGLEKGQLTLRKVG